MWVSVGAPSLANTIFYSPPAGSMAGSLSGQLPLERLGGLLLPRGQVVLRGDEMQILAVPAWLFDRVSVLRGAVVRAESVAGQGRTQVGGLVYFYDGQWLPNLARAAMHEEVDTVDGGTVSGRITGRSADALLVRSSGGDTQAVPFTQILTIDSPHAFRFAFSSQTVQRSPTDGTMVFQSNFISMSPVKPPPAILSAFVHPSVPPSNLPGTELALSNRAIATFVAIDLFWEAAPAIVTPLVLNQRNLAPAEAAYARFRAENGDPPSPPRK
jgi:hypothetical protein